MIKVGIIGAAGYTAGELLRLLIYHPSVKVTAAISQSQAGKPITSIHKDLIGEIDLAFSESLDLESIDVAFLCKGHGESKKILDAQPELLEKKVIDLSQDFRLNGDFIYGLPEKNKGAIKGSNHVANPGCFATAIQLGILPAIENHLVKGDIHISGITGSTGAGQSFTRTSHFSWRNNNASVYKPFQHQHLKEVGKTILELDAEFDHDIQFIPYRGAFTRGIIVTSYFDTVASESQLKSGYEEFYKDHPFTIVSDENPNLKMVINTNKCVVFPTVIEGKAMIISVIDNLLKGASGQAIQNMNLMFGIDEKEGLQLKATSF